LPTNTDRASASLFASAAASASAGPAIEQLQLGVPIVCLSWMES